MVVDPKMRMIQPNPVLLIDDAYDQYMKHRHRTPNSFWNPCADQCTKCCPAYKIDHASDNPSLAASESVSSHRVYQCRKFVNLVCSAAGESHAMHCYLAVICCWSSPVSAAFVGYCGCPASGASGVMHEIHYCPVCPKCCAFAANSGHKCMQPHRIVLMGCTDSSCCDSVMISVYLLMMTQRQHFHNIWRRTERIYTNFIVKSKQSTFRIQFCLSHIPQSCAAATWANDSYKSAPILLIEECIQAWVYAWVARAQPLCDGRCNLQKFLFGAGHFRIACTNHTNSKSNKKPSESRCHRIGNGKKKTFVSFRLPNLMRAKIRYRGNQDNTNRITTAINIFTTLILDFCCMRSICASFESPGIERFDTFTQMRT